MQWIIPNMRWIMVVAGTTTTTMIYAAVAPEAALQSTFGETLTGPLANIVVRNWGALIALVGAMLIYGAFDIPSRRLALVIAGVSKAFFVALLLSDGQRYLRGQAAVAVAVDLGMIVLFAWYLLAARGAPSGSTEGSAHVSV